MITLNISPDGDITISQETPGERIYMGEHYARMEREEKETERDEMNSTFFKSGWESAIQEAQLRYVSGDIETFFQEMKVGDIQTEIKEDGGGEPDDLEGYDEPTDPVLDAADPPLIRPAVDSGEPEKEAEGSQDSAGTWTISDEELQSRLDAEFERGVAYESPTVPRRYSDDEIAAIRAGGPQGPRRIKFSSLRAIADRVASEPRPDDMPANLETLLQRVAEELGYEVTR
ncbi:hypothetical protein SEA_MORTYSMITH_69 [Microbacterium phage MortySmith]|nr:hypothetical protein SEA_HIDDENLEAF_72 [Microbacterium phage Hiddenleaf]QNJ55693.1 hypothetical protein SEA_FREDDIEHG_72 [Microbacterium phage FreddieHg]QNN98554.1 hypothetical protein SEA_CHIVEY_72 [Microbacterium phage Chivey]WNM68277.1 hypothetical protein SEA_JDAWG_70 [Microbacterium phage JDawG]WNM69146.1 hypothetical protein SEA_ERUDITE_70 [Microbacterium phage Erudite]